MLRYGGVESRDESFLLYSLSHMCGFSLALQSRFNPTSALLPPFTSSPPLSPPLLCSPLRQVEDIISTLQSLSMIKKWQGQHIVSVRQRAIEEHLAAAASKPGQHNFAKPECIRWAPKPAAKPSKR